VQRDVIDIGEIDRAGCSFSARHDRDRQWRKTNRTGFSSETADVASAGGLPNPAAVYRGVIDIGEIERMDGELPGMDTASISASRSPGLFAAPTPPPSRSVCATSQDVVIPSPTSFGADRTRSRGRSRRENKSLSREGGDSTGLAQGDWLVVQAGCEAGLHVFTADDAAPAIALAEQMMPIS
jgi:hypothetical protein